MAILFIYSKGVSKGKDIERSKQDEASREQDSRIRKAEQDNMKTEGKKDDEINTITTASTIDALLGLWAKSQQGKGSDADKKSK